MIEISVTIKAPLQEVWNKYTNVDDVRHWAFAADTWAAEGIENNLTKGGDLKNRYFAKDGTAEFIFSGVYTDVVPNKQLAYILDDGRKVEVIFTQHDDMVKIKQLFEPEKENPKQIQKDGWQAYLDNFKRYVESSK